MEYSGSFTNNNNEYSHNNGRYNLGQSGPSLPPTIPSMQYPTLMQDDQKKYGYNSLTHGNGQGYYDVQSAYGTSCQPKFYVGQCPSNKFVRPFVPDANDTVSGKSCLQPGMLISEGYSSFKKPVQFFFEKTCTHCINAHKNLTKVFGDRFDSMFAMKDVALPGNLQMMSNLGGFATPFFFNEDTGCSATGDMSTPDLMKALLCNNKPQPSRMPTRGPHMPTHAPMNDLASTVDQLKMEVFIMNGCGWCDKLKQEIRQSGLEKYIKISDASEARKQNIDVRGFPHTISHTTGKGVPGYMRIPDLVARLYSVENYQSNDMASAVQKLQIEVFTMNGCGWCDKLKQEIRQSGLEKYIKISDASEARNKNIDVRGFPHTISHTTGKGVPGYMKIPDLVKKLS